MFFRFPLSKPELAAKWVQNLGMKNFVPTANTCLCSEHFRPECFRDYNGKQFLREDAVPTILSHETTKVGSHPRSEMCDIVLSPSVMNEPITIAQIELRKRGVVAKESNPVNRALTQAEQDRAKEAGFVRRDKRSSIRVSFGLPRL